MKTIIAGSRTITSYQIVDHAITASGLDITEVVSGKAKGVDFSGEKWAVIHDIPIKSFPADWQNLGKRAGIIRNQQMVHYADALIAIWDGKSRGTQHIIKYAMYSGLKLFVFTVEVGP